MNIPDEPHVESYRGTLALVTGGAGFIGSHLVEALLAEGLRVRVVDNLVTGKAANLANVVDRIEFVDGDLADFQVSERAVEGVSYVFHHAAIPSVPRSLAEPLESHRSGPTATLNVLEAARRAGVRRVIFASSSSVYGDTEELPKHEEMTPRPLSPYAVGKLAGEHYVGVYARALGLDGISLRYFNVFGPRQDPNSAYSGVIARFAKAIAQGDRPVVFGDGLQTRDFTAVGNVVAANLAALKSVKPLEGRAVNIGTGRRVSLLELVAKINQLLGLNLRPLLEPPRLGDVRDSQADLSLAQKILGYDPLIDFETALTETLADMGIE